MKPDLALTCLSLLFITSCAGVTTLSPTAPTTATITAGSPVAPAPLPTPTSVPTGQTMHGVVGPLGEGATPCWADRYACEVYDFILSQPGSIDVMLTWEGHPRDLMLQLYWAGEGLAHEDIAPRAGPSRINFKRPMMEAANYELRIVSLEPGIRTPFALTVSY